MPSSRSSLGKLIVFCALLPGLLGLALGCSGNPQGGNNPFTLPVSLPVSGGPVFTTQPASQTTNSGGTATFTAAATGIPAPSYQWQRYSTVTSTWADVTTGSGGTTAIYTTATLTAADSGAQFRVQASNTLAGATLPTVVTSDIATLTVDDSPAFTTQPASQTTNSGGTATFTAAATGIPAPTYQWQRYSTVTSTWADVTTGTGGTSAAYTTATLADADNGAQFRVQASNTLAGATLPTVVTSNVAILTVDDSPAFTTQPASQTTNSGGTATFTAAATGIPAPTYQWQRYSTVTSTWADVTTGSGGTTAIYTTATLTAADSGAQFRVQASNTLAGATLPTVVTSNVATLTVDDSPVFTTQPASLTTNSGGTATFTAAATGIPAPTYQWQRYNTVTSTWADVTTGSGGTTAIYTTATLTAADSGAQFRVQASNTLAGATLPTVVTSNVAILTVDDSPAFTTQPASQTTNSGGTATFTAAATGIPAPTYQWQRYNTVTSTWADVTTGSGGTTAIYTTATLADADNGAQFRVQASNTLAGATLPTVVTSNVAILTVDDSPAFTTQPASLTTNSGGTATFTAAATGNPAPGYQWQRYDNATSTWADVTTGSGGTTAIYTTGTLTAADSGAQFRVQASNTLAGATLPTVVTSNVAILTVDDSPAFTTQPASQTTNSGGTATFTAAATGNPAPTYQWQRYSTVTSTWADVTTGSGGTTAIYTTATLTAADSGAQFRVQASNTLAGATLPTVVTSNVATLTVDDSPVFTTQPASLTTNSGGTATFTAAATGNPAPGYQWQRYDNATSTWADVTTGSGGTTAIYTTGTLTAADSGAQFRVQASNTLAGATLPTVVTSNAAILTVDDSPVFTTQPASLTTNSGGTATFTAAATGNPAPSYQWQRYSTVTSTWADVTTGTGGTSAAYTTATLADADNGAQFRVQASNTLAGATLPTVVTSNVATLTVDDSPVFTTQPASLTTNSGGTATFTAAATGNPAPTYQWQRYSTVTSTWADVTTGSGGTTAIYTTGTLTAADSGAQFRVQASNTLAGATLPTVVTSNVAILTVDDSPAFTTQPASQTTNSGGTATFTAAATGNPAPTYQWQRYSTVTSTWADVTTGTGGTSAAYTTATLADADNGAQFRVQASNTLAGATLPTVVTSNVAILTVDDSPAFTTQPASQTTNSGGTATFTAAATGIPAPTYQWQRYSTVTSTWADVTTGSGGTTAIYTTATLTAADNGAQFRVQASNTLAGATLPTVVTSNVAILTVDDSPAFTTQPASLTTNSGGTATFTAAATGIPAPTYQWQRYSTVTSTWADVTTGSGGTTAIYTTATLTAADSGAQFRVQASNTLAGATLPTVVTSNVATLTVDDSPAFTTQPASLTTNSGGTATFTAAATGIPAPTYQWQRYNTVTSTWADVTTGSGGTTAIYTTATLTAADSGAQFRVQASNTLAGATLPTVVTSNVATLTVDDSPVFTTQPASLTTNSGGTATFTAAATGNPAPTYQWQRYNTVTSTWADVTTGSGGTTAIYTTATLTAADSGAQFRVQASNTLAGATLPTVVTSNVATLTVDDSPVFTTQPASLTTNSGGTATFTAAATGNPAPTYQWQRYNTVTSTWADVTTGSGGTTAIYTTGTLTTADSGAQFRVQASNTLAGATLPTVVTSNVATLTVDDSPVFITQPASLTTNSGGTATFTAAATGNPAPSYQWQRYNTVTSTWADVTTGTGGTSAAYTTATLADADNGAQFRVQASNTLAGATLPTVVTSNVATLTVDDSPVFITQPASLTTNSGGTATFTAAATGNPAPTYQWQRYNTVTSTWADVTTGTGGTSAAYTTATLADADNGAQFRVQASNTLAGATLPTVVTSNVAILTVDDSPAFTTQPASQTTNSGGTATFTAAATGIPAPTYQWQRYSTVTSTWADVTTGSGGTTAIYTTATLTAADSGAQFRVQASNTLAGATLPTVVTSDIATLTVDDSPVFTTQPLNQTANSGSTATFTAFANGNPPPTYQWQRSNDSGATWADVTTGSGGTTSSYTTGTLTNADNGAQFRVLASNAAAANVASNAATLTVVPVFTISGTVTTAQNNPVTSITVLLRGPIDVNVNTDGSGAYSFQGLPNGTYTVTPSPSGNAGTFLPTSATITVNGAPVVQNFQELFTYSISGTLSYFGSRPGMAYLTLQTSTGGFVQGTAVDPSPAGPLFVPYTISGIPPGTYTLSAELGFQNSGGLNANDPTGSNQVTVGNGNVTNHDITITDPPPTLNVLAPPAPPQISPIDSGVVVSYTPVTNTNGVPSADSYLLEWNADPSFGHPTVISPTFSTTIPASQSGFCVLNDPRLQSATYAFRLTAQAGATSTDASTATSLITLGAPSGLGSVSGTVTFPETPTGPLYAGFVSTSTGTFFCQTINSPVSSQGFTVAGLPDDTYIPFAFLDQNNSGKLDAGAVASLALPATPLTVQGGMLQGLPPTIALPPASGSLTLATVTQQSSPGTNAYSLAFQVANPVRLISAITLQSGPNIVPSQTLTLPGGTHAGTATVSLGALQPNLGDTYNLQVNYSDDGAPDTLDAQVTGVLNAYPQNFPQNLAPTGSGANPAPTFTWAAPATPPSPTYTYRFLLQDPTGLPVLQNPAASASLASGLDSGTTRLAYPLYMAQATNTTIGSNTGTILPSGNGTNATLQTLNVGTTYTWSVATTDANGNEAVASAPYTVLPAPTISNISGPSVVLTGQTNPYSATVTPGPGSNDATVIWLAPPIPGNPQLGTIDQEGNYTAPATPGTCTLIAAAHADPLVSSVMAVTVVPPPDATITAPATVGAGQPQFHATVPQQDQYATYFWTATNASLADPTTSEVLVTPTSAAGTTIQLTCTVTSRLYGSPLASAQQSVTINVVGGYSISGTVTAAGSGAPIANVNVGLGSPFYLAALTDATGTYSFPAMPPGTYTLTPGDFSFGNSFQPTSANVTLTSGPGTADFQENAYHTVQGTVTYPGNYTGITYLTLQPSNGNLQPGTAVAFPGPANATVPFTITGVPSGNYTLEAELAIAPGGGPNTNDPIGSLSFPVANADVGNLAVSLADAQEDLSAASIDTFNVMPLDAGVAITFAAPANALSTPRADAFLLEWSEAADFSSTVYSTEFPGNPLAYYYFLSGNPNLNIGSTYYFRLTAVAGTRTANPTHTATAPAQAPFLGPVTVGPPPSGGNPVEGTVSFPETPMGPLYVFLMDGFTGDLYSQTIPLTQPLSSPQAFTISGVPDGSNYFLCAYLDQNNQGSFLPGDVSNAAPGNGFYDGLPVQVSGGALQVYDPVTQTEVPLGTPSLVLPGTGGSLTMVTQHLQQPGTGPNPLQDQYGLLFQVTNPVKLITSVTLDTGPDLIPGQTLAQLGGAGTLNDLGGYGASGYSVTLPTTANALALQVNYSDSSSETLTAPVTGVMNAFATNLSPTGSGSIATPALSWTAPAAPPATYSYQVQFGAPSPAQLYAYPFASGSPVNWTGANLPSSQTSLNALVDLAQISGLYYGYPFYSPGYSTPDSLWPGINYYWQVATLDANGNQAITQTTYSTSVGVSVQISSPFDSVVVDGTLQFTASVTGTDDQTVSWYVDGYLGGDGLTPTVTGSIDLNSGLYTAPATVGQHIITAAADADSSQSDSVTINVSSN